MHGGVERSSRLRCSWQHCPCMCQISSSPPRYIHLTFPDLGLELRHRRVPLCFERSSWMGVVPCSPSAKSRGTQDRKWIVWQRPAIVGCERQESSQLHRTYGWEIVFKISIFFYCLIWNVHCLFFPPLLGSISCLKPRDVQGPLVFSGSYDNTVRLWDTRAKKAVSY